MKDSCTSSTSPLEPPSSTLQSGILKQVYETYTRPQNVNLNDYLHLPGSTSPEFCSSQNGRSIPELRRCELQSMLSQGRPRGALRPRDMLKTTPLLSKTTRKRRATTSGVRTLLFSSDLTTHLKRPFMDYPSSFLDIDSFIFSKP
ncbi:hypothetical protein KEM48_003403 [Puccinia striiformis f. sp. tritici PST-130]|nr:hypothetical protein H4Q26_002888 [Puccinia striiformis f. sp. tritici PST-130]KAI9608269.1 hypothetical protein KEM48_003403 [Puccinia striiformis f. sp. tritici PST-130]